MSVAPELRLVTANAMDRKSKNRNGYVQFY